MWEFPTGGRNVRHAFDGVKRSEARAKVWVSKMPNTLYPPEIGVHLPGGTLWLAIGEARNLTDDLISAVNEAERIRESVRTDEDA